MSSINKKSKVSKKHSHGRGRMFLKYKGKLKRIAFYNSTIRQQLKNKINEEAEEFVKDYFEYINDNSWRL